MHTGLHSLTHVDRSWKRSSCSPLRRSTYQSSMDIHLEPFKCSKLECEGCTNGAGGTPQAWRWLTLVVILRSLAALQEFMCLVVFHIGPALKSVLNIITTRNKHTRLNLHRSWTLTHSSINSFPHQHFQSFPWTGFYFLHWKTASLAYFIQIFWGFSYFTF